MNAPPSGIMFQPHATNVLPQTETVRVKSSTVLTVYSPHYLPRKIYRSQQTARGFLKKYFQICKATVSLK